ncbi:hypothetical protein QBC32DRAFT_343084 [Pseudoneurospora amorphoporcata]|uniref:Uncharacterized protein n=1 Tax=Pseudoneurospora amorphoporcata TaxID=241081 RepID=A0AAN6NTZ6_9PEZI|nr:hypothetical protein QBC32DRAFT_343084 [Pseudoneurospora amorphoporcata]
MSRSPDVRIENIVYDSSHHHKHTTSLPSPLPSPTFGTEFEPHRRHSHLHSQRGHLAPPSPRDLGFSETSSSGTKNEKMCVKDIFYDSSARLVNEKVYSCRPDGLGLCDVPEIRKHYQPSRSEPRYGGYLPAHLPPTPRESKEPSPVGKRDSGYLHGSRVSEPSHSSRHNDDYSNYKYGSSPSDSKTKSDVYMRPSVVVTHNYNVPQEDSPRRRPERDPSPGRGHSAHYKQHSKKDSGFEFINPADEDRKRRRASRPSDAVSTIATTGVVPASRPPRSSDNANRYGSSPNGPSGMDSIRRRDSVSSRNEDSGRTPRPRTISGGSRSRASSVGVRFADELESKKKQQNAEIASRTNKPSTEQNLEIKGILKKPAGAREESNERSKDRTTKGKGVEVDMTVEELKRSVESLGLRGTTRDRNVERESNVSSSLTGSIGEIDMDRLRSRFDRDNGGSTGRHVSHRVTKVRDGDRHLYY